MKINEVLKFFVPKDNDFFPLFDGQSKCILKASELLMELILEKKPIETKLSIFTQIKDLEHEGDSFTQKIYDHLNESFITPFDREDMHELASKLDDVLDNIHGVSKRIQWYKPKYKRISEEIKNFSIIINKAAKELEVCVSHLKDMNGNVDLIRLSCSNINTIEREADDIFYKYMSDLFDSETDPIELIKRKDIISSLERTVDVTEDVSDIIKTILIKNV